LLNQSCTSVSLDCVKDRLILAAGGQKTVLVGELKGGKLEGVRQWATHDNVSCVKTVEVAGAEFCAFGSYNGCFNLIKL
jgi:hypothetical protein